MSLKPPKKSDMGKKWMRDRKDDKIKIQPESHLIVTEGTKTEPKYFNAIKDTINKKYKNNKIKIRVEGGGDNTIGLFEKAKEYVMKDGSSTYKHVWVVYDTDDFSSERINRTVELCKSESDDDTTYHAIWSNQCIEFWYLLHFSYFQSDIERPRYWPKLTKHLEAIGAGEYKKNREDMFQILRPYMHIAIANAKKLNKINGKKPPASAAPGTKVYELIEMLLPYI